MKFISTDVKCSYYVKCNRCEQYSKTIVTKSESIKCNCGMTLKAAETNFFVAFDVESQISYAVLKNWTTIKKYRNEINIQLNSDAIQDVYSGHIFKSLYNCPSSSFLLPLCINTDGIAVFKSSKMSLWPILLVKNYLPPHLRYLRRNIIVAGLFFGPNKPIMEQFFEPLVVEFEKFELNKVKFMVEEGVQLVFEPIIVTSNLDLPAKSAVQQIKQYNGTYACTYCHHPGNKVPIGKAGGSGYRYGHVDPSPALRTNEQTTETMNLILSSSLKTPTADGIKGVSCLATLYGFDIIHGFGIDYMHILLGVVENLLDFWLNSANSAQKYYIKTSKKEILDKRILSLKPYNFIRRRPRSLDNRRQFKANELRSLLLYYLPLCLRGIHEQKKYYDHFMKLSYPIYLLLQSRISVDELNEAEACLNEFTVEFEEIYGSANFVMNIHLLRHMVGAVRNIGPLWTQSAFCFESYNGVLKNSISGNTDVLLQASTKYILRKTLFNKDVSNETRTTGLMGRPEKIYIDAEDILALQERSMILKPNATYLYVYKRYEQEGTVYTSKLYIRPKNTIDYFVLSLDGSFGVVKYFFECNNIPYAAKIFGNKMYRPANRNTGD